jgi:hypothetical protein
MHLLCGIATSCRDTCHTHLSSLFSGNGAWSPSLIVFVYVAKLRVLARSTRTFELQYKGTRS